MILILSYKGDPHAEYVEKILKTRKCKYVTYTYRNYPQASSISLKVSNKRSEAHLYTENSAINLKEVSAVWNRRAGKATVSQKVKNAIRLYIEEESNYCLKNLPYFTSQAFWLSHPDAVSIANRKPYQLLIASELGFQIPDTYVGNHVGDAKDFVLKNPDVALKYLHRLSVTLDLNFIQKLKKHIYNLKNRKYINSAESYEIKQLYSYDYYQTFETKRLKQTELLFALNQVSNCPIILQKYVDKFLELRVTIIGKTVFACAIHCNNHADYRSHTYELKHEPYTLPTDIEQKCFQLVKSLGLQFGCIDMLVTPDQEYIFLEINSNGQWLWIERLTGMPIGATIADLLMTQNGLK